MKRKLEAWSIHVYHVSPLNISKLISNVSSGHTIVYMYKYLKDDIYIIFLSLFQLKHPYINESNKQEIK